MDYCCGEVCVNLEGKGGGRTVDYLFIYLFFKVKIELKREVGEEKFEGNCELDVDAGAMRGANKELRGQQ